MLKVLILGSGGFIGRHLVRQLMEDADLSLSLFDRHHQADLSAKTKVFTGDFAGVEILKKALEGQDVVYHFISQTIPATSWSNPQVEIEKNLLPTLQMIDLAAEQGIQKICFASSGGTVYGLRHNQLTEESLTAPFSPYGIIKRTIESFLQYAKYKSGINYDIYRISNAYGEGQDIGKGLGFINTALEKIIRKEPIVIYGDGENVRDYLYVKDAAKLLTLSLRKELTDSDIYNVSSHYPISLNNLIFLIKKITGLAAEISYLPARQSDNHQVILDNKKVMSYFPQMKLVSLEDGIKMTFDYLRR